MTTRAKTKRRARKAQAPVVHVPTARDATTYGPPAGVVLGLPRFGSQQTHPLAGSDVTRVVALMAQSFTGYRREWEDLLDDMLDRDLRVAGVTNARLLAITGRPFSVKPALGYEDDPEHVQVAEHCARILARTRSGDTAAAQGGGWTTVLASIASAKARGLSVSEIEWGVSPEGWHVPVRIHWHHGRRFGFDPDMRVVLDDGTARATLESFGPDRFIVYSPTGGRAAYPTRRGFLLGCVLPSIVKRTDIKFWIKATERWGQPLPLVELPENATAEVREGAIELANKLAANFVGALWGGAKLAQVPGSGSVNPAIYESIADFCNKEIAIHVLGNNLNAEIQGGSLAAAQAAGVMRYDLLAADLAELDDCITQQLLERIVRYNWPGMETPRYESELRAMQPLTVDDVREGIVSEDEYRSSKGYEPKPDSSGSQYRQPATVSTAPVDDVAPVAGDVPVGVDSAADTALNGAQVTALLEVVQTAATGGIPRETAIALITTTFPVSREEAELILGDIGRGFVPAPEPGTEPAEPPPGGADAAPPFSLSATPPTISTSPTSALSLSESERLRSRLSAAWASSRSSAKRRPSR